MTNPTNPTNPNYPTYSHLPHCSDHIVYGHVRWQLLCFPNMHRPLAQECCQLCRDVIARRSCHATVTPTVQTHMLRTKIHARPQRLRPSTMQWHAHAGGELRPCHGAHGRATQARGDWGRAREMRGRVQSGATLGCIRRSKAQTRCLHQGHGRRVP